MAQPYQSVQHRTLRADQLPYRIGTYIPDQAFGAHNAATPMTMANKAALALAAGFRLIRLCVHDIAATAGTGAAPTAADVGNANQSAGDFGGLADMEACCTALAAGGAKIILGPSESGYPTPADPHLQAMLGALPSSTLSAIIALQSFNEGGGNNPVNAARAYALDGYRRTYGLGQAEVWPSSFISGYGPGVQPSSEGDAKGLPFGTVYDQHIHWDSLNGAYDQPLSAIVLRGATMWGAGAGYQRILTSEAGLSANFQCSSTPSVAVAQPGGQTITSSTTVITASSSPATAGFASSGRFWLPNATTNPLNVGYTGISGNTFTGCSVNPSDQTNGADTSVTTNTTAIYNSGASIIDTAAGMYLLRQALFFLAAGLEKWICYLFNDIPTSAFGNGDACGIVTANGTPKSPYTQFQTLFSILADTGLGAPRTIDFACSNPAVKAVAISHSSGKDYIAFWQQGVTLTANPSASPWQGALTMPNAQAATFALPRSYTTINGIRPYVGTGRTTIGSGSTITLGSTATDTAAGWVAGATGDVQILECIP